jgi:glycosyltransferase involved in cell wall biosynthesis
MARVLLVTPEFPYPPRQGASLRNNHILRALSLEHDVTLLSTGRAVESRDLEALTPYAHDLYTVPIGRRSMGRRLMELVLSRKPDLALRLSSFALNAALAMLLTTGGDSGRPAFDLVQIEGLELAEAIPIIRAQSPVTRILLDEHNAEAELQKRAFRLDLRSPMRWPAAIYSALQIGPLTRYEAWACRSADSVTCVSEGDALALRSLVSGLNPIVIPNSIDLRLYESATQPGDHQRFDALFVGKMDYRANVDAARWLMDDIWPLVRRARPKATLAIVGQSPPAALARAGGRDGVTVTGLVDDVRPYLFGAGVALLPLRLGSGTRLKLLEAMAARRAIVSTTAGAEGFPIKAGEHLLLADDAASFAAAVDNLLDRPDERARLGEAARQFARAYDWQAVAGRFNQVVGDLLAGRPSPA